VKVVSRASFDSSSVENVSRRRASCPAKAGLPCTAARSVEAWAPIGNAARDAGCGRASVPQEGRYVHGVRQVGFRLRHLSADFRLLFRVRRPYQHTFPPRIWPSRTVLHFSWAGRRRQRLHCRAMACGPHCCSRGKAGDHPEGSALLRRLSPLRAFRPLFGRRMKAVSLEASRSAVLRVREEVSGPLARISLDVFGIKLADDPSSNRGHWRRSRGASTVSAWPVVIIRVVRNSSPSTREAPYQRFDGRPGRCGAQVASPSRRSRGRRAKKPEG